VNMSATVGELFGALAKAQANIGGAIKGKVNPAFKSKYADLAAVWDAWQEVGPAQDLSVVQLVGAIKDSRVLVTTILGHKSGEWIMETSETPVTKADAQGSVSATTYARRCALSAMVGIAPEDDDGNAAVRGGTYSAELHANPRPPSADWPAGPCTSKTGLMTEYKAFVHYLHGSINADDVEGAITDASPMLAQFRAAAKVNILAEEYQGGGDFPGVVRILADARARCVASEGIPQGPGEVAGMEAGIVDTLFATLEQPETIAALKKWAKINSELINEQIEEVRDALRLRYGEREAGLRAVQQLAA
jgi:hypothetical protein